MWILHVEELEQRHLLSGGFAHPMGPTPRDHSTGTALMAPDLNPDFHNSLGGPGRFDSGPRRPAFPTFGPADGLFQPAPTVPVRTPIIRLPSSDGGGPRPDSLGAGVETLSTLAPFKEPAADRGGPPVVAGRLNLAATPAFLNGSAALPSALATTTTLSFAQAKGRIEEGIVAPPIVPPANRPSGESVNADGGKNSDAVKSRPVSAGHPTLAFITSAVDVARLSRGFRNFLDGIERSAESVSETDGLRTWIVAGVAAAVACELARRQLRRHSADTNQRFEPIRITVTSE
jgi:hypothetical protein